MRPILCKIAVITGLLTTSMAFAFAQTGVNNGPGAAPPAHPAQTQGFSTNATGKGFAPASRDRGTASGGNPGGKAEKN